VKRPARILVVGSSNTDLVVRTPRIPAPGETVLGGDLVMTPGGKGANQAVAAARLGAEVTLLARIGADLFGDHASESLHASGVSTDFLIRDPASPSGVALISVDDQGQNSIVVAPGSNARLVPEDADSAREAFERADVVVMQLEIPIPTVRSAMDLAHSLGKPVILNPAPFVPLPVSLLAKIEIITPNEQEAASLLGRESIGDPLEAAHALLETTNQTVVITLGQRGAAVAHARHREVFPAYKARAIDTTAAGDCFTGALAVALAEGRPLPESVRFANAAASISVTRPGAQESMPSRIEVEEILLQIS
jgi:ribokinase